MRQFFIANSQTVASAGAIDALNSLPNGVVAMALRDGGDKSAIIVDSAHLGTNKMFQILFGNTDVAGQHRWESFPFYANHLSYEVMAYEAPTKFTTTLTVAAAGSAGYNPGVYTLIFAKKGVPFNERNKWSVDFYVKDDNNLTAAKLAQEFTHLINEKFDPSYKRNAASPVGTGDVIATVNGAAITITTKDYAVDYEVILADNFRAYGSFSGTRAGITGKADRAMVIDLANKAIADRGINDTYAEPSEYMHPRYPITRGSNALAEKYDILTIRFAEPRQVKTRDEVVHQIIQIAYPKDGDNENPQLSYMTNILDVLMGKTSLSLLANKNTEAGQSNDSEL